MMDEEDYGCKSCDALWDVILGLTAERDSLRQQLAKPAVEWMPIETAPKDGTRVLVWSDKHAWRGIGIAYWGRNNPLNRLAWIGGHCRIDHIDQPTHWMPLPAAYDALQDK
jgi:hypothetical protein